MKIRQGFVSNSSSSSFIISSEYDKDTVLQYAKEQARYAAIERFIADAKYILKDKDNHYGTWEERQLYVLKKLVYLGDRYDDPRLCSIDITTVGELKNKECPPFCIDEWYSNLKDTDLVLFDYSDNFIPEEACEKIIKKFKCENYNTHMG